MAEQRAANQLRLRDLVLFNIAAVIGVRWLAAAAHVGPGSLTLWLSAAALFFIPCAIVVARLGAVYPAEGGLYVWTRNAFGDWHGFLCGWSYWLNNLFYYPTLILAGVSIATYIPGERYAPLADHPLYVVPASLAAILLITAANLRGLGSSKWIGNIGGLATYATGMLLIAGGVWAWMERGPANRMELTPQLNWQYLNFWPQIAFAFGGLELGAILGGEIQDARRNVRSAAWISGLAIALFYLAGTTAMLVLLPAAEVSIVTGLVQAAAATGAIVQWPGLVSCAALLATAGIVGQLGAWMTGTSRLPVVLGMDHFLPPGFRDLRKSLAIQAGVCSALLVLMQLGDNLRTGYQILVDLMVITYFIPFLYLFLTAWKLGMRTSAACGLFVTLIAITFSLIPPHGTESPLLFEAKLLGGTALLIFLARWWFVRCTRA
jgi:amino acid transporter